MRKHCRTSKTGNPGDSHHDAIRDQFTLQAVPFSTAPAIRDEAALRLLVESSGAGPEDTVLDVACGPGLVVCAFAPVVRHPSHVRALTLRELERLFEEKGLLRSLPRPRTTFYNLETDLEGLLLRSFPAPGDAPVVRRLLTDSLEDDALGMAARMDGEVIRLSYPIAVLAAGPLIGPGAV